MELILDSCALQAPLEQANSRELVEDVKALEIIHVEAKAGEIILWKGVNIMIEGRLAPKNIRNAVDAYWKSVKFKLLPQEIGFRGIRVTGDTSEDYELNRRRYERRLQEVTEVIGRSRLQDCSHLINAEYFGIPYFITTDYDLITRLKNTDLKLKVQVVRPIEFLKDINYMYKIQS